MKIEALKKEKTNIEGEKNVIVEKKKETKKKIKK